MKRSSKRWYGSWKRGDLKIRLKPRDAMKSASGNAFQKIGLSFLSLTLILAILEVALRIIGYNGLNRLMNGREQPS